ncbi:ABC drug exporter [Phlyctema vagabunda]|uniref:ABC drug exporter n=1 Tax=Phlyctema vagabunda TaxID=108571 RepID=A0ABR4PBS1_9HELO
MYFAHSDRTGQEPARVPLHNTTNANEGDQTDGRDPANYESIVPNNGTWGEQDGAPINVHEAMLEYADLRHEVSQLSRTKTQKTEKSVGARSRISTGLRNVLSQRSRARSDVETQTNDGQDSDNEKEPEEEPREEFAFDEFLRDGHFEKRTSGRSAKKVGVVYKNLTVQGVGATSTYVKTLPSAVLGTFGPDLYKLLSRLIPALPKFGAQGEKRNLISDFSGVVRDGEMLLVLGRPGSGCSTFLKAISNQRASFAGVSGEVSYGGISAEEQIKNYRGEISYNEEDDQHFPSLTVEQTLEFSLLNKTKKRAKGEIPIIVSALLRIFGISHTRHTLVGDAFIRGVSGGERKRVSIAETLATKASVTCWDSSTRGLDASTALDYANSLRVMTDISNRTTLVSLYQAGEGIYKLMDKVLVIEGGRMIYQGRADEAKAYFENLGYYCPDRQTTADFVTACCDPSERRFQPDFQGPIPKGPVELERAFRESEAYQKVLTDIADYEHMLEETNHADTREFKQSVSETKSKTVSKKSSYTVSYVRQVLACTKREFWLTLGDKTSIYTKFFISISMALIVGSLFYGQSLDTSGAFSRGGTLLFSSLFLGWLQLSELMKAVSGRTIIQRHNEYAFYSPSAVVIARVLQDLPTLLCLVIPFSITLYFMSGLDVEAGKFFIYFLFIYINTICLTALYRMFAALSPSLDDAVRFSGIAITLLVIFTGYVIGKPILISKYIWFGWLYYVNPVSYSFEAVLTNEFAGRTMTCALSQIVPRGPGYNDSAFQGCAITGAHLGSLDVTGTDYLRTTFQYSRSNLWRNFGVVIAFTVLYVLVTAIASEVFNFAISAGGALEFVKTKASKRKIKEEETPTDVESGKREHVQSGSSSGTAVAREQSLEELSGSQSVFTWSNVEFTVPYLGGQKKLLNKVSGYAKPGLMVALVGASGAGKTTLLNTLSQRQKVGVISGDMLVDGRTLGPEFQRGTGFCEQMDLHDGTATIREALEFSAILRQDRTIPRAEKIAYVDKIIKMLELEDLEDVLVRCLGVEQKKRVTIGVELAARPNLLLFLDEPTSGLDSQSAYSIVRFLKKLAQAGQAIVCTIHQPSSVLIQEFDMILALNPGGNTFYFGPVGENGKVVIDYFAKRGVYCDPAKNIAEFVLETAARRNARGEDGKRINWNQEWLKSDEAKEVDREIERIVAERRKIEISQSKVEHEFASPIWLQTTVLTKRMFAQYWRDYTYLYSKIFTSVILGIFNGFTFWQLGNTVADMQNRMFTLFLLLIVPPVIVNSVVPKFWGNRALWEARELPSRIYDWRAFCTANIVAEIPIAILGAVIYWVLWYWPAGLPTDSSSSGYVFLMTVLFFLWQASWGQWITAFAGSFTVISNVLPFFFVIMTLFNGVVRPYSLLPVFWRYWMYYVNPATWWIGGVLAATLKDVSVECAPSEAAYFNPPPGQTCEGYAANFITQAGGYLTNPREDSNCGYCPYQDGVEYMATLNITPDDKWRYLGIFAAYCIINWMLVYFFIYTVRIKGWTFGLGAVFGLASRGISAIKGLFHKKNKEPAA